MKLKEVSNEFRMVNSISYILKIEMQRERRVNERGNEEGKQKRLMKIKER